MYQMAAGITVLHKIILCAFVWLAWQVTGCRAYLEAAKDAEGEDGFRPLTFHSWVVYDETWIEMDDLEVPSLYQCYTPKQCLCLRFIVYHPHDFELRFLCDNHIQIASRKDAKWNIVTGQPGLPKIF